MNAATIDAGVDELLDCLTPAQRSELDEHLAAIALHEGPQPDYAYQLDPIGWARDVLGVPEETIRWSIFAEYRDHKWDGTRDPLAAIAEALAAGKDVGVESATGTGKTYEAAILALWFFACFADPIVVTTAPKKDQLTKLLWKEIGRHWPRFKKKYPHAQKIELTARMKPGKDDQETWAIVGFACGVDADEQSATRAQGFHAEHMLVITEETPGIHAAVMIALGNTRTSAHNLHLALGNPDNQQDELHKFCTRSDVVHVRISALDHPNVVTGRMVIPGATSSTGIARIETEHARGTPMYDSRVRGISPKEAVDALIKYEWLERAANVYDRLEAAGKLPVGPRAKGVDVANSESGDKAAIADGAGPVLLGVRAFPCPDANQLGRDVLMEMQRDVVIPFYVGVDPVGVGAGTVNEMVSKGANIVRLNGAASPIGNAERAADGTLFEWVPDANSFNNLRSQMFWQLREDFRNNRIAVKRNPFLFAQLTTPRFKVAGGKTIVESKKDIIKRLGQSPNEGDAVVYWNWVRPRAKLPKKGRAHEDIEGALDLATGKTKSSNLDRMHERMERDAALARQAQRLKRPRRNVVRTIPL